MAETDAQKAVRQWREYFDGKGSDLALRHRRAILEGDAAYQRKHGREELAQALEALARELADN